jgi:hypothetical protein
LLSKTPPSAVLVFISKSSKDDFDVAVVKRSSPNLSLEFEKALKLPCDIAEDLNGPVTTSLILNVSREPIAALQASSTKSFTKCSNSNFVNEGYSLGPLPSALMNTPGLKADKADPSSP